MDLDFAHSILDVFVDFLKNKNKLITVVSIEMFDSPIVNNLLEDGIYFDKSIIVDLKRMRNGERRIMKVNGDINIKVEFWDSKLIDKKLLDFVCDYIYFLVYYFSKINSSVRDVNIYLYNYDGKKNIPDDNILRSINVNSGLTLFSGLKSEVLVYRKEEMIKVLTHELIHAFGIDNKYIAEDKVIGLTSKFCTKNSININETFTDAFACLLNVVMFTILESKCINFNKKYKKNLKLEVDFIKAQSHKVLLLNNYNLSTRNITCNNDNFEETNGIAYYVLKAVILDSFPEYIIKQNYMLKDEYDFIKLVDMGLKKVNWLTFGKSEYIKLNNKRSLRMSSIDIINLINLKKTI
jgi:hypothetical protein